MVVLENENQVKALIIDSFNELAEKQELKRLSLQIYSKKETAKLLRVSYSKIQTLIKNGYLTTTKDDSFITYKSILEYTKN